MKTSETPEHITYPKQISSVEDSPAKMSPLPERNEACQEPSQASGLNTEGSSKNSPPGWSSSKMSIPAKNYGSPRSKKTLRPSDTETVPSHYLPRMSEHHTCAEEFSSLLPTPTASTYGANTNPGKPPRLSLSLLAKRGLLATPTGKGNQLSPEMVRKWPGCQRLKEQHPAGPLHPQFVEWIMGFPIDYTA